ncbi:MAG: hypothetical protein NC212_10925 [Staphylococcus sp.]|nr:hypothetical protein [Staphylococcus sp.]
MIITQDIFEYFCPVALTPGNGIFSAVSDSISLRFNDLKPILGLIHQKVADSIYSPLDSPLDDFERLCQAVARFVCVSAFKDSLPQLDLVLTGTGFGVVSNGNVAPASSDRVERLATSLQQGLDNAFDEILSVARLVDDWASADCSRQWFLSLFWRGKDARLFGNPNATRSDLLSMAPAIATAEAALKELVSPEFFSDMCAYCRKGVFSPLMQQVVALSRSFVVAIVKDNGSDQLHKRALLKFIESFPEVFTSYFSSSAYRANHFQPYENKKEDSCFFFG